MMNILSKVGVLGMNHFLYKQEGNGSIAFALNRDGNSSQSLHQTNESVLNEDEWNHLLLTHNPENGTLNLFANGIRVIEETNATFTSDSYGLNFRFSNLTVGKDQNSFLGLVDDLRFYQRELSLEDVFNIYNSGGGDYKTLKIISSGITRITARQAGNEMYEIGSSSQLPTCPKS